MSKYSHIESRTAVLTRGNAEGQYSCSRLNMTVRGKSTCPAGSMYESGVWQFHTPDILYFKTVLNSLKIYNY